MRELIGRVAVTDGDMASALKVIALYDGLLSKGASTAAILRATAALADTTAGFHDSSTGRTIRVGAEGRSLPGHRPEPNTAWTHQTIDRMHTTSLWLERAVQPGPLDELILERCAQTLRARLSDVGRSLSTTELIRVAVDPQVTAHERATALAALPLSETFTVLATPASVIPGLPLRVLDGAVWIALAPEIGAEHPHPVGRAGAAVVTDGDVLEGRRRAEIALGVAVHPHHGGPAYVGHDQLGSLADIVAVLTPVQAAGTIEVVHLERLRALRAWLPVTFYRLWTEPSLRSAARVLHIHHSTLHERLNWLDQVLGYSITTPSGRERAATAWAIWRVSGLLWDVR